MWHCPYRYGYDYYAIVKDSKTVYCVFNKEEIKKLKMGETVEARHYGGCPRHINPLDDFKTPVIKDEPKKKYTNVLDDLF